MVLHIRKNRKQNQKRMNNNTIGILHQIVRKTRNSLSNYHQEKQKQKEKQRKQEPLILKTHDIKKRPNIDNLH